MPKEKAESLKTAVVDAAFAVIAEEGLENLSLREIARRLNVSHQAPYRHFPSRDHILAAVVARCFTRFAEALENRPATDDKFVDLRNMGLAYLSFAEREPLAYRLMFNTPLPEGSAHPDMLSRAQYAFNLLRSRLETLHLRDPEHQIDDPLKHDAMFIWAALHGLASLMHSDATATVGLSPAEKAIAVERLMKRLGMSLEPIG